MKNNYHEYALILMKTEEIKEKIWTKSRGCTSKITHISFVKCPMVPNLILNIYLDTACLPK